MSPLPLPHRQNAFSASINGQNVASAIQLRESHWQHSRIQLAHPEHVQSLQGLRAPDPDMCLRLPVASAALSRSNQLSWWMNVHAKRFEHLKTILGSNTELTTWCPRCAPCSVSALLPRGRKELRRQRRSTKALRMVRPTNCGASRCLDSREPKLEEVFCRADCCRPERGASVDKTSDAILEWRRASGLLSCCRSGSRAVDFRPAPKRTVRQQHRLPLHTKPAADSCCALSAGARRSMALYPMHWDRLQSSSLGIVTDELVMQRDPDRGESRERPLCYSSRKYRLPRIHFLIERNYALPVRRLYTFFWLPSSSTLDLNPQGLPQTAAMYASLTKHGTKWAESVIEKINM